MTTKDQIKQLLAHHGFTGDVVFESDTVEQQMLMALSMPNISRVYSDENGFHIEYNED